MSTDTHFWVKIGFKFQSLGKISKIWAADPSSSFRSIPTLVRHGDRRGIGLRLRLRQRQRQWRQNELHVRHLSDEFLYELESLVHLLLTRTQEATQVFLELFTERNLFIAADLSVVYHHTHSDDCDDTQCTHLPITADAEYWDWTYHCPAETDRLSRSINLWDSGVPSTRLQVGKSAFSAAGPAAWNNLLTHVQISESQRHWQCSRVSQDSLVWRIKLTSTYINGLWVNKKSVIY